MTVIIILSIISVLLFIAHIFFIFKFFKEKKWGQLLLFEFISVTLIIGLYFYIK